MGALSFDPGLTFWTVLTFGGLFLVLARFAFKPLQRLLDERERRIQDALDKAEAANKQALETLAKNQEQLDHAAAETRRMINEGHRMVADMKTEARQAAEEDSERIIERTRAEMDRELEKSLSGLKNTVANLSLRIARQVIKGELDETRHEELADDLIERLKKTNARR